MVRAVSVQMFAANDGSLHETSAGAIAHDGYIARKGRIETIAGIIGRDAEDAFRSFDRRKWDDLDEWDRTRLIEEIASMFENRMEAVCQAIYRKGK